MSDDLVTFILARIAEDAEGQPDYYGTCEVGGLHLHPDRLAAECDAKRRIVKRAQLHAAHYDGCCADHCDGCRSAESGAHVMLAYAWALRPLALPYSGHPDYRQEWAP